MASVVHRCHLKLFILGELEARVCAFKRILKVGPWGSHELTDVLKRVVNFSHFLSPRVMVETCAVHPDNAGRNHQTPKRCAM
jgi:hypothetical protein